MEIGIYTFGDLPAGVCGAAAARQRPQEIVDKILYEHELFGHERFLAQLDIGGLPFTLAAQSIERLATEVLPAVQRALGAPHTTHSNPLTQGVSA